MLTEPAVFKERLRCAWQWKRIRVLLIADTLIALLLFALDTISGGSANRWLSLAANFIFCHAIGASIYFLIHLTEVLAVKNRWKKLLWLIGIFIVSSWVGSLMAFGLFNFLFEPNLEISRLKSFFIGNPFLAAFFGALVLGYFLLRDKFERVVAQLAEKEINEQRLLRLKTKAELEALRAKVNPHFLFNTLNSIASLIPVDPAKAEEMVQKLSHLFRYTLDASNHDMMTLSGELALIREYLEIEKVRLGERLSFQIEMDAKLADISIPGLLLQPLVENSVKHGIAPAKSGGNLRIQCREQNGRCQIEIADTGKGFNKLEVEEGFGLSGVRDRLALHYGNDYAFEMAANSGVRILLCIPLDSSIGQKTAGRIEKPKRSELVQVSNG
jgi:sensor histidine kinase YesM